MPVLNCRHFTGYKPCSRNTSCDDLCPQKSIPSLNILLVHLGALGAVVRSTSLLTSIRRKYPGCRLFWLTDGPADRLLQGHPLLDAVYETTEKNMTELAAWDFDLALVVDKSRRASGLLRRLSVDQIFGFQAEPSSGAVVPSTAAAVELWEIGLSNQKKFFENQKPETRLIHEALELGEWKRDPYFLPLTSLEQNEAASRKLEWQLDITQPVIGLNTGASATIEAKKWTVEYQRQIVEELSRQGLKNLVLLGGPEDQERNQKIAAGLSVIESPTQAGLRDGLVSVEACDLVISGDSLGMHMAIARGKYVIAWFGPTCAHEIDLYDRGEKILAQVNCGPCWKRVCANEVMCYDRIELATVIKAVERGRVWLKNQQKHPHLQNPSLLSKPHFSEI